MRLLRGSDSGRRRGRRGGVLGSGGLMMRSVSIVEEVKVLEIGCGGTGRGGCGSR